MELYRVWWKRWNLHQILNPSKVRFFRDKWKLAPFYAAVPCFLVFGVPLPCTSGHIAQPHGRILKNPRMSSSALGLGILEKSQEPQQCTDQKQPFLPNSGRFPAISLGLHHTERGLDFFFLASHRSHAVEILRGFFQNSYVGPSYVATRMGRWRPDRPKNGERLR